MTVIKDYAQKGGGCLCGAIKTYATWDKVNDVAKFSTDQGYWIKNAVYTTSGGCTYPNSYQDSVMIADVTSQGYTRVYWDKTVDNAYTCVTTTTTTTTPEGCDDCCDTLYDTNPRFAMTKTYDSPTDDCENLTDTGIVRTATGCLYASSGNQSRITFCSSGNTFLYFSHGSQTCTISSPSPCATSGSCTGTDVCGGYTLSYTLV